MSDFGYKYIDKQLKNLVKHITAILREDPDIENVHQARVSSRRLRAAFELCEDNFDSKNISRWKKQIKKLLKSLGPARDKDVLIDALQERIKNLGPDRRQCRAGIRRMILRMTQQREKMNKSIQKSIRQVEKSQVISEIGAAISRNIWHYRLNPESKKENRAQDLEKCADQIGHRLSQLVSMEPCLAEPDNVEGHHKMRIGAKKLRYTMEICKEPFGKRLAPYIKRCKKVQNLAGEIHDCDVWADIINAFEKNEHKRAVDFYGTDRQQKRLAPGINYLREYYASRRAEKFASLVVYWEELKEDQTWEKLTEFLRNSLEQPDDTNNLEPTEPPEPEEGQAAVDEVQAPQPKTTGSKREIRDIPAPTAKPTHTGKEQEEPIEASSNSSTPLSSPQKTD